MSVGLANNFNNVTPQPKVVVEFNSLGKKLSIAYKTKWVWLGPYDKEIVARPVLRLFLTTPYEFRSSYRTGNYTIVNFRTFVFNNVKYQETIIDLPFFTKKESLFIKKENPSSKNMLIDMLISNWQDQHIALVHESCNKENIDVSYLKNNIFNENSRVYFTCENKASHIKINIYHEKNWKFTGSINEYGSFVMLSKENIKYSRNKSIQTEINLISEQERSSSYSYFIINKRENNKSFRFSIGSEVSFKNYIEIVNNSLGEVDFSQLDLDLKISLLQRFSASGYNLRTNASFTIIPMHLKSRGSQVATFYNFNFGVEKEHQREQLYDKFITYLGWHLLGMNTEVSNWGIDLLTGPKISLDLVFDRKNMKKQNVGLSYIYNIGGDSKNALKNSGFELKYKKQFITMYKIPVDLSMSFTHHTFVDSEANKTSKLLNTAVGLSWNF